MANPNLSHQLARILVGMGVLVMMSSWVARAQNLATCMAVEPDARQVFDLLTDQCALDRSPCAADMLCTCTETPGSAAQAACADGCGYQLGAHVVLPTTIATIYYTGEVINGFALQQGLVGYRAEFTAGPAQGGSLLYLFAPGADLVSPLWGGICFAALDGQNCRCFQRFCDASQTTFHNVIDCTNVPGGGVLDLCDGLPQQVTTASLPMEILFWLPYLACEDPNRAAVSVVPIGDGSGTLPFGNGGVNGGSDSLPPPGNGGVFGGGSGSQATRHGFSLGLFQANPVVFTMMLVVGFV